MFGEHELNKMPQTKMFGIIQRSHHVWILRQTDLQLIATS